jgi:hypothetical protein
MRTARFLTVITVLLLAGAPAMAAWVGDVPDLVNPVFGNTLAKGVVCLPGGDEYNSIATAYSWAAEGDTILMGPGLYREWNANTSNTPAGPPTTWVLTKTVNFSGSGSAADPNTNTVWAGWRDPNIGCITGEFVTLKGPAYMTLKNFRVQDGFSNVFDMAGTAVPAVHPGATFENLALVNYASRRVNAPNSSGFGDGIVMKESTNALLIKNCLFDGGGNDPNTGGDIQGIRLAGALQVNNNGVVDGCTFTNGKVGLLFNAYKATNWKITNNTFSNMTKYAGTDPFNAWGNVGIEIYPRHNATAGTEDASVNNWTIMSNTFADCGYTGAEGSDPAVHPWADTLAHEAGIGVTLCTGTSAQDIWINHNTFSETAGVGGTMKRGINIVASNASTYDLPTATAWTGPYGFLKNFVVGDNNFTGLDKAVRAIQYSAGAVVTPQTAFPSVLVKSAGSAAIAGISNPADVNGDGKIDGYDVSNLTADLDGIGGPVANNADKVYLVETLLRTKVGDFNLDGKVDGLDFLAWQSGYDNNPATPENYAQGECNWSNDTDGLDFLVWQAAYPISSNVNYPASYGPVPEPATIGLLVLGGLAALRRRR